MPMPTNSFADQMAARKFALENSDVRIVSGCHEFLIVIAKPHIELTGTGVEHLDANTYRVTIPASHRIAEMHSMVEDF